ncbi:putative transposase, MuDR, plant [Helianthus annuus]|uniref:Transposase, MuDR, plant n=1 Tax=Helianthus annuus TaxID=4232 RepID=A0A251S9U3_HELAN|nr:putative transposase, MuDR, plant [Helianthus annuus]KAJ0451554.1 putative transposase, MuDR, plant [Helianthus annuus]KAJ0473429.1 putative transposase, MuDR, plant [Helianthus annuus]KAJ0649013.1 putative transposase, MuDR, plant [Helianthus annuus]KAJ0831660.1 putative transposase, MuDR, plant [Helianthus annuus]
MHQYGRIWLNHQYLSQMFFKYKIKLKYGGYFRSAKNSSRKRYCFGYQKCVYIDTYTYNFDDLVEEVTNHYPSNRDFVFSVCFVDKYATEQSFIKLDSHENFQLMLKTYEVEKELTVYVTTSRNLETSSINQRCQDEVGDELYSDEESEYSLSDESYRSCYSTDNDVEQHNSKEETYTKKSPTIRLNSKFENITVFRRTLIHYALRIEFEYFIEKSEPTRVTARCVDIEYKWRIHASVKQDGITIEVDL